MTITLGPYEAHGAYGVLIESEQFDTTGVGHDFCPDCEHEPCVAGRRPRRCVRSPRAITTAVLQDRIEQAIVPLHQSSHPAWLALVTASIEMGSIARHRGEGYYTRYISSDALWALARMAHVLEQKPEATA